MRKGLFWEERGSSAGGTKPRPREARREPDGRPTSKASGAGAGREPGRRQGEREGSLRGHPGIGRNIHRRPPSVLMASNAPLAEPAATHTDSDDRRGFNKDNEGTESPAGVCQASPLFAVRSVTSPAKSVASPVARHWPARGQTSATTVPSRGITPRSCQLAALFRVSSKDVVTSKGQRTESPNLSRSNRLRYSSPCLSQCLQAQLRSSTTARRCGSRRRRWTRICSRGRR